MPKRLVVLSALVFAAACDAPTASSSVTLAAPLCESTLGVAAPIDVTTAGGIGHHFGSGLAYSSPWLASTSPGASGTWLFFGAGDTCEPRQFVAPPSLRPSESSGGPVDIADGVLAVARTGDAGTVDLFTVDAEERWTHAATLSGDPNHGPVTAVALGPGVLAVGRADAPGVSAGIVEIYTDGGTGWAFDRELDDDAYVRVGSALEFDQRELFVGADGGALSAGAILTFAGSADWARGNTYRDPVGTAADRLGASLAFDATTVYGGAPGSDVLGTAAAGRVVTFDRATTAFRSYVDPERPEVEARFGAHIAVSSTGTLAVASIAADEFGIDAGAVSVFDVRSVTATFLTRPDPVWRDGTTGIGSGLAFSDGYLFVGIAGDNYDGDGVGAVLLLGREDGFADVGRLRNPRGFANTHVGYDTVSATADRVLAGARKHDGEGAESGAAFVFARRGAGWAEEGMLVPDGLRARDSAGAAVLLLETIALVGVPGHDDPGGDDGMVAVFELQGSTWSEVDRIVSPDPNPGDYFGGALAAHGEQVAVGEPWGKQTHVLRRGTWEHEATIDGLGAAVALRDGFLLAGHPYSDETGGTAKLYREEARGTWLEVATLEPPTRVDGYGQSVALGDSVAFVWAPGETAEDVEKATGVVYVFAPNGAEWKHVRTLVSDMPSEKAHFGSGLAIHGDLLALSASGESREGDAHGAVYLHGRDVGGPNAWGRVRRIVQNPPADWVGYGSGLAWSGADLVVSAPFANGIADGVGRIEVLSNAVNAPPAAADDVVSIPAAATEVIVPAVANDGDPNGDLLFVLLDGEPGRGVVSPKGAGEFLYVPGPDFEGSDSFTYVASDCQSVSAPATVQIIRDSSTCDETTPCPDGDVCVGQTCFSACTTNDECGAGEACFGDHCAVTACDGVICADGELCYAGSCFAACSDGRCGAGECFDGRCAESACDGVTCAADQICAGGSCFATCTADEQCLAEQTCFDGRCATDACDQFQCPTDEVCIEGSCFAVLECSDDDDCGKGRACIDDVCETADDGCCRTVGGPRGGATPLALMLLAIVGLVRRRSEVQ